MGMSVIIVGAGQTTRQLLRRLGEAWDVTVVDVLEVNLVRLKGERPVTTVIGDGTSRLVLRQAGLDDADALVAATADDATNLEVCRIGRETRVMRIVAVATDPDRLPDYRDVGITTFSPARLAARQIELQLEARRVASKAFAGGRVEALDFQIAANSPVRGKSVAEVNGPTWMVAALLRRGELTIPTDHEDLSLEPEDVVTVVGSAASLPHFVQEFTAGVSLFPSQFGKRVAVALKGESDLGRPFVEAVTMTRNSQATSLLIVHPTVEQDEEPGPSPMERLLQGTTYAAEGIELRHRPVPGAPTKALPRLAAEESIGVIVVPAVERNRRFGWYKADRSFSHIRDLRTPVLFARGKHSYDRILVAARRTPAGRAAAHAAIDLASTSKADLVALAVTDPVFMAGSNAPTEARVAIDEIKELAALQGVDVRGEIRNGNPILAFLELSNDFDLVVLGIANEGLPLQARVANRVVARSSASVLIVPTKD